MRTHIFTERERKAILEYLKTRQRNPTVNYLFHVLGECEQQLILDVKLLVKLLKLRSLENITPL